MNHDFSRVPRAEINRSSFDRSSNLKTTFNSGFLIPIFVDEALPGDTFNLNMTGFARFATPLHPVMDNVFMNTFFFAVPLRLLWDNFQRFMGEQPNPGDSTDFVIPQIVSPVGGYAEGSLFDYMGLPTGVGGLSHSAMWPRAYNLIYNEWFRDQNLCGRLFESKGDGPDAFNQYTIIQRGKRHDYFTSSLPWPQKGDSVDLPLGSSAPVVRNSNAGNQTGYQAGTNVVIGDGAVNTVSGGLQVGATTLSIDPNGTWSTDLTNAASATINQLRQAFALQQLLERDARGGTRYTEILRAHFSVVSPDARLQRPEYLGGGQSMVNLHTVPQNSGTGAYTQTPQGNLAAYGTVHLSGHGFSKSFTEHCVIIGLVSVRADLNYQQGLNRMWSRNTKYDFYWPTLAHIGEQAVLNKEIYAQGSADPVADEAAWGYQERFGEYRYKPSIITGAMRSSAAQSLDTWHLAQDFASLPALNQAFIFDNPPIARVIAVPSEPEFILDAYFKLRCARPMPVFGVPGMTRL